MVQGGGDVAFDVVGARCADIGTVFGGDGSLVGSTAKRADLLVTAGFNADFISRKSYIDVRAFGNAQLTAKLDREHNTAQIVHATRHGHSTSPHALGSRTKKTLRRFRV